MKRFFVAAVLLAAVCSAAFPQEQDDNINIEENPIYEYKMNGKGDQYVRLGLMPFFPLNFNKQLTIGGALIIGYHRFLTDWLAVGGDFMATYNPTKGSNVFYTIPITGGVTFQPTVWKLEFPISLNVGMAFEASQSKKYFPGLILSADAGVYFRYSESWSFGVGTNFVYMPQWYSEDKRLGRYPAYDYGLFLSAAAMVRYHF